MILMRMLKMGSSRTKNSSPGFSCVDREYVSRIKDSILLSIGLFIWIISSNKAISKVVVTMNNHHNHPHHHPHHLNKNKPNLRSQSKMQILPSI